jgi:hypothetical protein
LLLEGLGKLKNFNDLIGSRIRDLLACSKAPQPSMLQSVINLFYMQIIDCVYLELYNNNNSEGTKLKRNYMGGGGVSEPKKRLNTTDLEWSVHTVENTISLCVPSGNKPSYDLKQLM